MVQSIMHWYCKKRDDSGPHNLNNNFMFQVGASGGGCSRLPYWARISNVDAGSTEFQHCKVILHHFYSPGSSIKEQVKRLANPTDGRTQPALAVDNPEVA